MALPPRDATRSPGAGARLGVSLLELLVVVTLLGVFAAAAVGRVGHDIFGDTGVRNGARMLSLSILAAQRNAIRTGESHGVAFQHAEGSVSSWTVFREQSDGLREIIDGPFLVPQDYKLKVSGKELLLDFEGAAASAFEASFLGPHRTWLVSLAPLTQMISSQEVKK